MTQKELLKKYQDEQAKRTFVFLPTLDLYVLREFLTPFSILIFAFLLLFLIGLNTVPYIFKIIIRNKFIFLDLFGTNRKLIRT